MKRHPEPFCYQVATAGREHFKRQLCHGAMETVLTDNGETDLAARVAPEDLRRGDFVAILSVVYEYPSFLWCSDSAMAPREELVHLRYEGVGGGLPLKIKAVCLPFVFVKDPAGEHRTLDARMCRLARLSSGYARRVWKAMRRARRQRHSVHEARR